MISNAICGELGRLAVMTEENPQPILSVDAEGQLIYLNTAARRAFPDLILFDTVHPLLAVCTEIATHLHDSATPWQQGTIRYGDAHYAVQATLGPDGALLVFCHPVHVAPCVQQASDTLGLVAHELRSPLAVVKTAIDNLRVGACGPVDDLQSRMLAVADKNCDRMLRLITDIFALHRMESGREELLLRRLNTAEVVEACVTDFQLLAQQYGLKIRTDIDASAADIYADSDQITQVLMNLLANALRFATQWIVVQVAARGTQIQISVIDDGPGLTPESMEQIFQKFSQGATPPVRGSYRGVGLGLALCREIVTRHHGRIWAESTAGQGAWFHVALPAYPSPDESLWPEMQLPTPVAGY